MSRLPEWYSYSGQRGGPGIGEAVTRKVDSILPSINPVLTPIEPVQIIKVDPSAQLTMPLSPSRQVAIWEQTKHIARENKSSLFFGGFAIGTLTFLVDFIANRFDYQRPAMGGLLAGILGLIVTGTELYEKYYIDRPRNLPNQERTKLPGS